MIVRTSRSIHGMILWLWSKMDRRTKLAWKYFIQLTLLAGFANLLGMIVWLFLAGWLNINLHLP